MKLRITCPGCKQKFVVQPKTYRFPEREWRALWKQFDKVMNAAFGRRFPFGRR